MAVERISSSVRRSSFSPASASDAHHVVARLAPALGQERLEVRTELDDGLHGRLDLLLRQDRLDASRRRPDLGLEAGPVLGRHAHELADDGHGERSANSVMNSTSPRRASSSRSESTSSWTAGRSRSIWRGVNERETSRRRRVWSGGSAISMLCWPTSKNSLRPARPGAEDAGGGILDPDAPPEPGVAQHGLALVRSR